MLFGLYAGTKVSPKASLEEESPRFKAFLRDIVRRRNIPMRTRAVRPKAAPKAIPRIVAVFVEEPLFAEEGAIEGIPEMIVKE